jgi:hypothetical protein
VIDIKLIHFHFSHIPLTATFTIKPQREISIPRPPPVFS